MEEEPSQFDPSIRLGAGPRSQNNNSLSQNQHWLFFDEGSTACKQPGSQSVGLFDANDLRGTVDSVKKRIEACIKADGGHFENFL
ncbi:unnamed protein product, partial [Mesorhabditis belari]|uniref:Uncharacterized protein n=1 Tax=Mesorhabditis belari TaxID=2138241 RepID=A0AAF3F143_9BILA